MPGVKQDKFCIVCRRLLPHYAFYSRMLSWRSQSVCKQCSKHDGGAFSKHLRECAEYKRMENERQKRKTAEIKARERKRRRNAQARRRKCEQELLQRIANGKIGHRNEIDQKLLAELYLNGYPTEIIAEKLHTTTKTITKLAKEMKLKRPKNYGRYCKDCWLYPCFQGIDNFSTNFALKCQNWHPKDSKG